MRFLDLLRFASGGVRGHRLRTALSLLGVAIGVASVILLTSLGEGARRYIIGEFASLGLEPADHRSRQDRDRGFCAAGEHGAA